jgi:hypothetical protein
VPGSRSGQLVTGVGANVVAVARTSQNPGVLEGCKHDLAGGRIETPQPLHLLLAETKPGTLPILSPNQFGRSDDGRVGLVHARLPLAVYGILPKGIHRTTIHVHV